MYLMLLFLVPGSLVFAQLNPFPLRNASGKLISYGKISDLNA